MKRVILSGGGTGGHIYPAITIAKELAKLDDVEFLFVGTPKGMESQIIPREGYQFASLEAAGLKRKLTVENIGILLKTAGSLFTARKILKDFKPDVVIGTGGYVCGPILLAAALSHIPTLIQEQNVIPGVTNKILSRFVDKIALGYEDAASRFPHSEKCEYTGNPIRPDVISAKRVESRKLLGIHPEDFMVLITGGSRGAKTINTSMIGVHKHFKDMENICLYHVTGDLGYDYVTKELGCGEDGRYGKSSRIIKYEYHMPNALAAADLIICRAGAISLAEVAARAAGHPDPLSLCGRGSPDLQCPRLCGGRGGENDRGPVCDRQGTDPGYWGFEGQSGIAGYDGRFYGEIEKDSCRRGHRQDGSFVD